jgi:hypothetical protein
LYVLRIMLNMVFLGRKTLPVNKGMDAVRVINAMTLSVYKERVNCGAFFVEFLGDKK